MMVTSSLCCGEFYILYIGLLFVHYAGDLTIIQYIVYNNIGPEFCVRGCDIAGTCEGYITSEDAKLLAYYIYYKTVSILHILCLHYTNEYKNV